MGFLPGLSFFSFASSYMDKTWRGDKNNVTPTLIDISKK